MQISGLNAQYLSQVDSLSSLAGITSAASSSDTASTIVDALADSTVTAAAKTEISGPGQLYSKLEKLQAEDPDKFKQVVSDIADKLQQLSASDAGSGDKRLADLAAKFKQVADTGDLSALKPPSTDGKGMKAAYMKSMQMQGSRPAGPPPGGGHGGPGGPGGAASSKQSDTDDDDDDDDDSSSSSSSTTSVTDIRSQLESIFSELDTALS